MALHEGPSGPRQDLPETDYQPLGVWKPEPTRTDVAIVAGIGVLAGLGLFWALAPRRRRSRTLMRRGTLS
jgi:hypothetical protein